MKMRKEIKRKEDIISQRNSKEMTLRKDDDFNVQRRFRRLKLWNAVRIYAAEHLVSHCGTEEDREVRYMSRLEMFVMGY